MLETKEILEPLTYVFTKHLVLVCLVLKGPLSAHCISLYSFDNREAEGGLLLKRSRKLINCRNLMRLQRRPFDLSFTFFHRTLQQSSKNQASKHNKRCPVPLFLHPIIRYSHIMLAFSLLFDKSLTPLIGILKVGFLLRQKVEAEVPKNSLSVFIRLIEVSSLSHFEQTWQYITNLICSFEFSENKNAS
jgi:hypothetical protein